MLGLWKNNKTKKPELEHQDIVRLRKIGEDYADFMGKGQRKGGALPTPTLNSATRGEIRAGLIEQLLFALQLGAPFWQQCKWVESTGALFCWHTRFFDTTPFGGEREFEEEEIWKASITLWDLFQDLITKDGGKRFEINEGEIRERVVIKLIEQTM